MRRSRKAPKILGLTRSMSPSPSPLAGSVPVPGHYYMGRSETTQPGRCGHATHHGIRKRRVPLPPEEEGWDGRARVEADRGT